MLNIGTKAPNFTLLDKNNKSISLSDFLGKKVILYFYPKDNTPGCTKQALSYKEMYEEFVNKNTVVIGISKDSVSSHIKFSEKYDLPFILLSDQNLDVLKMYEVWGEKKLYGKPYMGVIRSTYLINEEGIIEYFDSPVKPDIDAKNMYCKI